MTPQKDTPLPATAQEQITYMLSFLMIIVDRAGGEIIIENLSEYAGGNLALNLKLDQENDRAIIKVAERVEPPQVIT